jgi:hypothetical protein
LSDRNRPIFVVGAGRSGTALLQALIGSHPRIAAPPEMHFFRRIAMLSDYWGDLDDDANLRRVVEATIGVPQLSACGFDLERVLARAAEGPRTYAGVLDAVMTDFTVREGKQRWSEKTPLEPAHVIWTHFPTAQLVHIVRDPFDTIASNLKKTGVWNDPTMAAVYWRRFTVATIAAGAQRGAASYFRIRFEDLVRDPEPVMRLVCTFIEEDYDPGMVSDRERRRGTIRTGNNPINKRVLDDIDPNLIGASARNLTPSARKRIAAAVGNLLPALGYPAPGARDVLVGHAGNALRWPGVAARTLRWRAVDRWGTPQKRKETVDRHQDAQINRRRHKEAAARRSQAPD